jgi:hypothetical protein
LQATARIGPSAHRPTAGAGNLWSTISARSKIIVPKVLGACRFLPPSLSEPGFYLIAPARVAALERRQGIAWWFRHSCDLLDTFSGGSYIGSALP